MQTQNRRQFLKTGGAVAISAFVPSFGCDSNKVTVRSMPTSPSESPMDDVVDGMHQIPITPNFRFYLQSINGKNYDPRIKAENWRLRVNGLVDNPIAAMTYDEILDMPMEEELQMTMQCIGNWIGGPLVGERKVGGDEVLEYSQ